MHKILTLSKTRFFSEAILFSLAICLFSLSGFASIALLFSPVPIVIQVNIAILYGAIFGPRKAVSILLSSYLLAMFGVPMFAGGAMGAVFLVGPTGGYLAGYILAAFVMGKLVEKRQIRSSLQLFSYFILANLCVYALGMPYLSLFIGIKAVLVAGFLPFIPGMILKNIFLAKLLFAFQKSPSR